MTLLIFSERREIAGKFVIFVRRWRFHGVLTTSLVFLRSSMAFIRHSTWWLPALLWQSLSRRALRVHCAFTALTLRWRRFCLHSRIVEITVHVWPCINRLLSSSHARTHRLLSLGVFLRLRLRIISTASASSICLKCISVMVQRMFICIHHSIYTILFGLFNVMKTPICAMIAVAALYNCCRSAVRKIALLVTAIDAPWKPGRTQWGCKERRRLV